MQLQGKLPHFADANIVDDMEEYNEASIEVGGREASAVAGAPAASLVAAHVPLDVMGLSVARLREELRKRGLAMAGNKSAMQERLKEAIELNVPYKRYCGLKGVAVLWTHHDWNEALSTPMLTPRSFGCKGSHPQREIQIRMLGREVRELTLRPSLQVGVGFG